MKVKDLIKALQACDPETEVEATFERCDKARMDMAKSCIEKNNGDALAMLTIDGVHLEQGLQGEDEYTIGCVLQLTTC